MILYCVACVETTAFFFLYFRFRYILKPSVCFGSVHYHLKASIFEARCFYRTYSVYSKPRNANGRESLSDDPNTRSLLSAVLSQRVHADRLRDAEVSSKVGGGKPKKPHSVSSYKYRVPAFSVLRVPLWAL